MTKPTLVFVHGAFSTNDAFNYFKLKLSEYPQLSFSHDWNTATSSSGKQLADKLRSLKLKRVVLLGHSLGGNVIIHSLPHLQIENSPVIDQVITFGSPFGGSQVAPMLRLMSTQSIFRHISPRSPEIQVLQSIATRCNKITSFVTHRGPLSSRNDGVVTVASQTALTGPKYIPVATNHMEVLLSEAVVKQAHTIIQNH